ncbi:leucine-rich repeat domain-containing protein [Acidobacteriota bacterium]
MAKDLGIIKQLEKAIGKELKQLNLEEIIGTTRGYAIDENVIGLNLYAVKKISVYSFLNSLKNLTVLDLSDNQLSDISFLSDLTNLTHLNLEINQISDISILKTLTNLTHLNLEVNEISDISVLSCLTNLMNLDLGGNQISDISSLKNLENLTFLNLNRNKIADISILNNLTNLDELYLSSNQISDIFALKDLKKLTRLYLDCNQISDISTLRDLTNLTGLNLSANQIFDISFLKDLTNLIRVDLSYNKISHLPVEMVNWNIEVKWKDDDTGDMILVENPIEPPPKEILKKEKITGKNERNWESPSAEGDDRFRWDVFISYSSKDFSIIKKIVDDLKQIGIRYWWDEEQLQPGDSISEKIEDGLKRSRYMMPCFSHNQKMSGWCRAEYTAILNKVISKSTKQKVVPLIIDDLKHEDIPLLMGDYKYERLSDPRGYEKLLQILKKPE